MTRRILPLALCLALAAAPVAAQGTPETAPETPPGDNGTSLMEEGARLFLRGLLSEMEPALDDMARALTELEPMMRDLVARIDDITAYQMPEILENGDILIRRKPDAPPWQPRPAPQADPPAEIDL